MTRRYFIKQEIGIERRYMEVPPDVYYDFMNFYTDKETETLSFIREDSHTKTRIWIAKSCFGEYKIEGFNIECLNCSTCKHNAGSGCVKMLHVPTLETECYERRDFDDCIIELDRDGEDATGLPEDNQPEGE